MLTQPNVNLSCFECLSEPRRTYGNFRHDLIDIVVLALCGTICYCETWEDIEDFGNERKEWLSKYLRLENGIPGHDTIAGVISRLDTATFFECLQQWIDGMKLDLKGKGIHIDGKTARHSFDSASNLKSLHMVSAWVDEASICLGQVATDKKSNEITAVPMLLELIEIKGAVVTLDAMGCQQKIVEKIIEQEADYVITVKGNQPKLHQAITGQFEQYFEDDRQDRKFRSNRKNAKSRGRITHQEVIVAPVPPEIKALDKWEGIQSIGMVHRHREPINPDNPRAIKETDHVTYFKQGPSIKLV